MAGSGENAHFLAESSEKTKDANGTVTIFPRGMDIIWGGDPRYWTIPKKNDHVSPAELHQVCWLEVTTSVDNTYIKPNKKYQVGFEISFEPDAFGWGSKHPIYFMTKRGNGTKWTKTILTEDEAVDGKTSKTPPMVVDTLELSEKDEPKKTLEKDDSISFGLYEVWSGKWKGGLKIHKAFVKEEDIQA